MGDGKWVLGNGERVKGNGLGVTGQAREAPEGESARRDQTDSGRSREVQNVPG
jgi:hypothetical protein